MRDILVEGLTIQKLPCEKIPALLDYADALLEKNKVMNLTAITEPQDVAKLHLLDCTALLTHFPLKGKKVVDVGTGAGFPGMVLRLMEDDFDLTLLDSLGKRVDWLRSICETMDLHRVDCIHARAEEFALEQRERFDIATSRAVAQLIILAELALPLVKVGGQFLAMKSVDSDGEIDAAKGAIGQLGGRITEVWDYTIPTTDITHRVVAITKVRPTPPQFPRPFAKIKKQPLK